MTITTDRLKEIIKKNTINYLSESSKLADDLYLVRPVHAGFCEARAWICDDIQKEFGVFDVNIIFDTIDVDASRTVPGNPAQFNAETLELPFKTYEFMGLSCRVAYKTKTKVPKSFLFVSYSETITKEHTTEKFMLDDLVVQKKGVTTTPKKSKNWSPEDRAIIEKSIKAPVLRLLEDMENDYWNFEIEHESCMGHGHFLKYTLKDTKHDIEFVIDVYNSVRSKNEITAINENAQAFTKEELSMIIDRVKWLMDKASEDKLKAVRNGLIEIYS